MPFITFAERYGLEKGLEKGRTQAYLDSLAVVLEMKFGAAGLDLLPELHRQTSADFLHAFLQSIRSAGSLDELRALLPAGEVAPG